MNTPGPGQHPRRYRHGEVYDQTMPPATKRAEIIRTAYLAYHSGRIDLPALLATLGELRRSVTTRSR